MKLKRALPQYVIGLLVMALGIVLIKKSGTGVSPVSAIPSALANITPMSFGQTTIVFMLVCWGLILLVQRRVDVKTLLIVPVAIAFGYLIDLYMLLLSFGALPVWLRYLICLAGIALTALGIVLIMGAGLMLPAPDALLHTVSTVFHLPYPRVKIGGDGVFVVIAAALELMFCRGIQSIWIGTLLSVLLTGRLAGVFRRLLPQLNAAQTAETNDKKTDSP
ncbi:MAG: DUF6198 family protein [Oscillospiraceae bacterium]|nr:DUF6198 family protein [Oscillospiraceae bacterium]